MLTLGHHSGIPGHCTFQKKGHQLDFNSRVQDSIVLARNKLEKLKADPSNKNALSRADFCLDEGAKAMQKRQKHILIADHHYEWYA